MSRRDAHPEPRHDARAVSAKELAEMGFRERRVLLAHRYDPMSTPRQRVDRTWAAGPPVVLP